MTRLARTRPAVMLIGALAIAAEPCTTAATMYECTDTGGGRVFTDSPAQLKSCVPLGGTNHFAPVAAPSVPAVPFPTVLPPESDNPIDIDKPPSYFPGAMVPPPELSPSTVRDVGLAPPPHESMAASTPEQASSQRCASPMNPFNPMMTIPCPPTGAPAQPVPGPEGSLPPPPFPHEAMPPPLPEVSLPAP